MSKIIVATDFSDVANNAIQYACDLATDMKFSVVVLHSFIIPVSFGETPLPLMPVEDGIQMAEAQMKEALQSTKTAYPGVDISSNIMYGDIVDCLEEFSQELEATLLIIGNGGSGDAGSWPGSSVARILKHRKSTVIAVPPEARYKRPENICFACDLRHMDEGEFHITSLAALLETTGAKLHILNINDKTGEGAEASLDLSATSQVFDQLNAEYHHVESHDINDTILEFVEAQHMDWLAIFPHKHSFLEGLFHKSHTKAVARKIHVPLVSLTGK